MKKKKNQKRKSVIIGELITMKGKPGRMPALKPSRVPSGWRVMLKKMNEIIPKIIFKNRHILMIFI